MLAGTMAAGWLSDLIFRQSERAGLRGTNIFRTGDLRHRVDDLRPAGRAAQLGLNTSLLLAIAVSLLGTVGLVIALALGPGLVPLSGNVAASRYVREGLEEGDVISVSGIEGTVENFGYASITLRAENGDTYQIPNRTLLENVIHKKAQS